MRGIGLVLLRIVAAAFFPDVISAAAQADTVTLSARDGDLEITGELLGFDGAYYRLDTEFGEVSLDRADVTCGGVGCPVPDRFIAEVTFSGDGQIGTNLMPPLLETFARRNGLRLEREAIDERSVRYILRDGDRTAGAFVFRIGTSAEGFADLVAGEADIAMSMREVTSREAAIAREAGRGRLDDPGRSRIVGLDALVPVVAVSNPLETISLDDLVRLARGEIQDWAGLAGSELSGPIALHLMDPETGLGQAFVSRTLGGAEPAAQGITWHRSPADLSAAVAADRAALGVTAFSSLGNAQSVPIRGPCGVVSSAALAEIKSEDYPLTLPAFLYAPARRLPDLATAFVDFATSPAAQGIVRRSGLVDQFPIRIPIAAQGDRLAAAILGAGDDTTLADLRRMVGSLNGRSRLSISFRFEDGSTALDAQSRSNVLLLAQAIERGVFDRRTLSFVGFSDGEGLASTNRRLSQRRAEAVRTAIMRVLKGPEANGVDFVTAAFGEALPMACDETAWGRRVNRRVEVWLD